MTSFKPGITPEPNRLIKLKCYDWSPYVCEGMFIPYKGAKSKKGTRFCRRDENGKTWSSDRKAWQDCEDWEYAAPVCRNCKKDTEPLIFTGFCESCEVALDGKYL